MKRGTLGLCLGIIGLCGSLFSFPLTAKILRVQNAALSKANLRAEDAEAKLELERRVSMRFVKLGNECVEQLVKVGVRQAQFHADTTNWPELIASQLPPREIFYSRLPAVAMDCACGTDSASLTVERINALYRSLKNGTP